MKTERRPGFGPPLAVLAALVIMALSANIAAAHTATITKADPAAGATVAKSPSLVMAQFDEEVVSQGSAMKVLDAGGKQVSQGDGKLDLNDPNHQIMLAVLPDALPDGVYTVQYHVVLTDGDATDGSYKFTVKSAASAAQYATATTTPAAAATAPAAAATAPTPAPTAARTVAPTAAPSVAPSPRATYAAAAQPTARATPGRLPRTGAAVGQSTWLVAALAAILLALGLIVRRWPRAR